MAGRRHKKHEEHEEHENEERWLVSYADMMTLLFCLFMVLFAISSVNTSKFEALSKALQDAFSGAILSGGKNVMQSGSETHGSTPAPQPPLPSITPLSQQSNSSQSSGQESPAEKAALKEQQDFLGLKRRIDALARQEGVSKNVHTEVRRNGLTIELLTDGIFFGSGSATLLAPAVRLLDKVGAIVASERVHPVLLEAHRDPQPIRTSQYPSNWQLSGARAAAVVQNLAGD